MLISAIATPHGRGGVAIVRVSGEGALSVAQAMFPRKTFEPNRMYAGEIDCGVFKDYGMCVYFKAPRSFTGEDVVEFHCHGGVEIARGVLSKTLELGCRLAMRGEFTERAFLHGKLSLSAAEGMAEMINAESAAQVRAGYLLYGERLTAQAKALQRRIRTCLAGVEADVDYPEEDLNPASRAEVISEVTAMERELSALVAGYRTGKKIHSGVRVAICGRPNAGKSSLFNALLGYDRAIVSSQAGTTRDTLEDSVEIGGVLFRLTDTAGLRAGESDVEREGIRRAERAIEACDLILYLKEEGETPQIPPKTPVVFVGSKCDVRQVSGCDVAVSSVTGEGLEALRALMLSRGFGAETEGAFLLEERHLRAAKAALEAVAAARNAAESGLAPELYAEDLRRAHTALGEFSGETSSEDVIREIFDKFCVGK